MKASRICLLVLLTTALSLSAGTRIIPIAGHLSGANGTSWRTDVSLTNNGSTAAAVELVFRSDNGLARSRSVVLPAGSSVLLADAVRPESFPGSNPSSWLGQLEVHSQANISASARTFTAAPAGGTYGSAYESFDPEVLSTGGALSGLLHSPRFRSNVAYANPGGGVAIVSYTARGGAGDLLASSQLLVPAHSTVQTTLSRDVALSPFDRPVMVEWSSTTPLYAIASVIDNESNDPANFPSSFGATELFFPMVGKTSGAQSTFWSTSAAIGSRADLAGTVTFAYRDQSGSLFTRSVTLPAHGTIRTEDLNAFLNAGAGSGSLTITSTVRIVASMRVFNTLAGGSTYGSALLPQERAVRSSLVEIQGVRRDAAYRLNVSLSGHSEATDGTVRLFDDNGREVESEPFHLESDALTQVNLNRSAAEVRSGRIRVETRNGVSVTAVASSIDNSTGDTSVREAEQENERQHELEIRISPSTATVGAPVGFTIGQSSDVSSVRWIFGDGTTGNGVSTSHSYAQAGEYGVTAEVTLTNGAVVRSQEDVHVLTSAGSTSGSIDFSWSPLNPSPGQQVTFTASRTSSGGSFKWKFPGDVRVDGGVASFTFPNAGSFEVELELEHAGNTTPHARHIVTVGGAPSGGGNPSIDFTWAPAAPAPGQQVTFTASGGNGGVFVFKFPGNIRKTGTVVAHTFTTAGSYEVELEQEKEGSATLHATHAVNVGGGPSTGGGSIDFTWLPSSPAPGQEVVFTASGGNGGVFVFKFPGNIRKTGTVVTHTFASAGSHEVELEQEKEGSTTLHANHVVNVGGGPVGGGPVTTVDFSWSPSSPRAGQTVTFTATSNGQPPASAYFKWRMPDDSRPRGTTTTYVFSAPGTYKIRVELEQNGVPSIERERSIVIAP